MYQPQHDPYYPNMAVIKKYFNNKLVLTEGILHIVSIAISIIAGVVLTITAMRMITPEFLEMIGDQMSSVNSSTGISPSVTLKTNLSPNIAGYISPALMAFTSLFIYFKSKNEKPESNPAVGFLIKYIAAMVGMIAAIVGAAIVFSMDILFGVISGILAISDNPEFLTPVLGLMICFSVIMAVTLIYAVFQFQFVKSVRLGFKQSKLENKCAKGFGVASILSSIVIYVCFALCGLFGYLFLSSQDGLIENLREYIDFSALIPYGIIMLFSMGVSFAIAVINAKIAFGYHKYVDDINSGRLTPEIPEVAYIEPIASPVEPAYREPIPYPTETPEEAAAEPPKTPLDDHAPLVPKYCTNCGSPLSENSVFCSRCGTKV